MRRQVPRLRIHDVTPVAETRFGNTTLRLLPQKAAHVPQHRCLLISDLHIGKAATFRAAGAPIPENIESDLDRLSTLVNRTDVESVLIVGDLLHARSGRSDAVFEQVTLWRKQYKQLHIGLIAGNHDQYAGPLPEEWRIEDRGPVDSLGPLKLIHDPDDADAAHPSVCGHLHPVCRIPDGQDFLRVPCFLFRQNACVLPAFSSFVDGRAIRPTAGETYYGCVEEYVVHLRADHK